MSWKQVLHTLRNANKNQAILCLIFFSVCGPEDRLFLPIWLYVLWARDLLKKINNAFDYWLFFAFTLCLLINCHVLAGGKRAGKMTRVNVQKGKKSQENFLAEPLHGSWCVWCVGVNNSNLDAFVYIYGKDRIILEVKAPGSVTWSWEIPNVMVAIQGEQSIQSKLSLWSQLMMHFSGC